MLHGDTLPRSSPGDVREGVSATVPRRERRRQLANLVIALVALLALVHIGGRRWLTPADHATEGTALPAVSGQQQLAGGFHEDGVYVTTDMSAVPKGVPTVGNWPVTGDPIASLTGPWLAVAPSFDIMFAGYPASGAATIAIEFDDGTRQELLLPDAGERWAREHVELTAPPSAFAMRVQVLADQAAGDGYWLGLSSPFHNERPISTALWSLAAGVVRTLAATSFSALLLLGPGLLLARRRAVPAILVPLVGLGMMVAVGIAIWLLPISRARTAFVLLAAVVGVVVLAAGLIRERIDLLVRWQHVGLAVLMVALVGVAMGRSLLPPGPPGELYGGTISRTLEIGDRSDSRVSYAVVQIIANHLTTHAPESEALFAPYSFESRGAIAALAATPVVLSGGAVVPTAKPDEAWSPFDAQGFMSYRAAMVVLASLILVGAYGIAAEMAGRSAGLLAAALTASAPFVVHDTYFTWPKLFTAYGVLVAAWLALRGRPVIAGLALGCAYLIHPLALLSAPVVVLVVVATGQQSVRRERMVLRVAKGALMLIVSLAVVGIWLRANGGTSQSGFLDYLDMADRIAHPSAGAWIRSRLHSTASTLVPLFQFFELRDYGGLNRLDGTSSGSVVFILQYWTVLPFALGLSSLLLVGHALVQAARRWSLATICLLVLPFVGFVVYWGFSISGLLREGLHVWFVTILIVAACALFTEPSHRRLLVVGSWLLLGRCVELLAMVLLPPFAHGRGVWFDRDRFLVPVTVAFTTFCTVGLAVLSVLLIRRTIQDSASAPAASIEWTNR